ncbi:MAG: amino acid ABC transporter substrate-binding protein [Chloroflexi bacterium]|nr:amino acid ABC transporter substrate-binding protein [Chloroflexota bacterium]
MKRVFFPTMEILLLVLSTTACVAKTETPPADHLEAIRQKGTLVVGTSPDYPPFEFLDATGEPVGLDIELIREIVRRMGVEAEIQTMPFDELIGAVQQGTIDVAIAAFQYSEERDQNVDFSEAYYEPEDGWVVNADFMGEITGPEDIRSYKVGVLAGTVQDAWVTDHWVTPGLLDEANVSCYQRLDQAGESLQSGQIEVLLTDYVPAQALVKAMDGLKIAYHAPVSAGPVGILLPDGDQTLQTTLNEILAQLRQEGFLDRLVEAYFGGD